MGDLIFVGGFAGAVLGNQQFTSRNLSFQGSATAIGQIFDWGEWDCKNVLAGLELAYSLTLRRLDVQIDHHTRLCCWSQHDFWWAFSSSCWLSYTH